MEGPKAAEAVISSETLTILGGILTGLIALVGKVIVDIRGVKAQNVTIHNLVNSRMTLALTTIARLARSIAKSSGDPEDIKIAEEAEKALETKLTEDIKAKI